MRKNIRFKVGGSELEDGLIQAGYFGERVVFQGKEGLVAALVPLEDLELLEALEGENSSICWGEEGS